MNYCEHLTKSYKETLCLELKTDASIVEKQDINTSMKLDMRVTVMDFD